MTRAIPWLGAAVALVTLGSAIRRKGFIRGTMHTAMDFTPFVGALKNVAEIGLGRDLFRDKPQPASFQPQAYPTSAPSRRY